MIKIANIETAGWEAAIRGMRNPMNSWHKSDTLFCKRKDCKDCPLAHDCKIDTLDFDIGPNDYKLMMDLAKKGSVHAKYRRMIVVYVDIVAPLYWWKEFDTYKVGTVANSCSTMHTIHQKRFTLNDFSVDYLDGTRGKRRIMAMTNVVSALNAALAKYLETKDDAYWHQLIQLLPSSYNQKRTVMLNYEVLADIYASRKNHKLEEWQLFCARMAVDLPYSELFTLAERKGGDKDGNK